MRDRAAKTFLSMMVFLVALSSSCQFVRPTHTPPPGWRSPASDLMVDDSAFPADWFVEFPEDTRTDPTVNHVGRSWGHTSGAGAEQAIWRAYTTAAAGEKYDELLGQSHFHPSEELHKYGFFVQFEPPAEIEFKSQVADQFYLACGWRIWAYCEVVARSRNYVVDLRTDRQTQFEGRHQIHGLTDAEIETLVEAMDAKFVSALESLPTPIP